MPVFSVDGMCHHHSCLWTSDSISKEKNTQHLPIARITYFNRKRRLWANADVEWWIGVRWTRKRWGKKERDGESGSESVCCMPWCACSGFLSDTYTHTCRHNHTFRQRETFQFDEIFEQSIKILLSLCECACVFVVVSIFIFIRNAFILRGVYCLFMAAENIKRPHSIKLIY